MPDLVNRRTAQTRAEIVDAALALFVEHGFDETPMEQVAQAAGVSRRTIYRYFETKDDLVFDLPRQWLEVLNETLDTREPDESTRDVFHRALIAVVDYIETHAEITKTGFAILSASPTLMGRHGRSDAEWVARYVALLAPDVADEPDGPLIATTAAMAIVGAQNALMAVWATTPGANLVPMTHAVLEQIDSLWPAASREHPSDD